MVVHQQTISTFVPADAVVSWRRLQFPSAQQPLSIARARALHTCRLISAVPHQLPPKVDPSTTDCLSQNAYRGCSNGVVTVPGSTYSIEKEYGGIGALQSTDTPNKIKMKLSRAAIRQLRYCSARNGTQFTSFNSLRPESLCPMRQLSGGVPSSGIPASGRKYATVSAAALQFGQPVHETHPHILKAGESMLASQNCLTLL